MINRRLVSALFVSVVCVGVFTGVARTEPSTQQTTSYPILTTITKFKAPPYPDPHERETYDYRIKYKKPIPPTLLDVMVCDVWAQFENPLNIKVEPKTATPANIKQSLNVYLTHKWDDIIGYRPWTHQQFIRGLKPAQRDQLAKEIVDYAAKNGVKEVD